MKKSFCIFTAVLSLIFVTACNSNPTTVELEGSVKFAAEMKAGWNLGNTLDAQSINSSVNAAGYNLGLRTETSWGAPVTTEAMIKMVAEKGFTTIRIPVSYHNHISNIETYKIDDEWLSRVKEIVDWSLKAGLKVIINIHHDNLSENQMSFNAGFCVSTNVNLQEKSKLYIQKIWEQVAEYFKSYDENLIFEVLNEPRCVGTYWEWNGGSNLSSFNKIITSYEQVALDAIRGAGEQNLVRYVMVPPYAASPYNLTGWTLPEDSAEDKLLVSVHAYSPYNFAMGEKETSVTVFANSMDSELDNLFSNLYRTYVRKGTGVVMGEASASDKNNTEQRLRWFKSYNKYANRRHVSVVLWDNMETAKTSSNIAECHGYLDRRNLTWFYPTLVEAMINAYN